ncbi:protein of unknown function [Candidatus Hydrogenisulfobacillus filiaventi]|uniref:Uncharacterized protein n=1 Tax=Candidatus Hydrogenisulfobacillus filiaventi TaxID=2707344 RepID=A0A6F8ZGQ9_9FIRM|nr:protein of unknown function [Candidatus Hydrogenisulfobacillus filiaventi]
MSPRMRRREGGGRDGVRSAVGPAPAGPLGQPASGGDPGGPVAGGGAGAGPAGIGRAPPAAAALPVAARDRALAAVGGSGTIGGGGGSGLADLAAVRPRRGQVAEEGSGMQVQVVKVPRLVGRILQLFLGLWDRKR